MISLTHPVKESEKMSQPQYEKFQTLEEEKRQRILNAAMHQFLNGYKNASTDSIVKEAGISKGLLFHYFGTKENLYNFLVNHAITTVQTEYIDLINTHQPDILDSIWQLSLLKQDLSKRFPTIFEFLTRVYVDDKDCPAKEHLAKFHTIQANMVADIYAQCDKTLFREDIPPDKIIEIILWTVNGFSQSKVAQAGVSDVVKNYDTFLEEFQSLIKILKQCFYK